MPLLGLKNISKSYGAVVAVDALCLSIERGEIFGLLGPSGCGKTTTLRIVLGLQTPDAGVIEFEGRDITKMPAEQRGFGMVFQNYALFTELNVYENLAFGMKARSSGGDDIAVRVENLLALVRLHGYEGRHVEELSAGQQQRVAIARAIAMEPPLLLFDEPMANLDTGLRRETGQELRKLLTRLNLAALYVTHDQAEAFALCDRLGIMSCGRIIQTGTPREIYERPCDVSVVQFLGFNLIEAQALSAPHDGTGEFKTREGNHVLHALASLSEGNLLDQPCMLAAHPEDILVTPDANATGNVLRAIVCEISFGGAMTNLKLDAGGLALEARLLRATGISPNDTCFIAIPQERIIALPTHNLKCEKEWSI